jgi:uncharacterized membrane protein (DUF2068 family)
MKRPIGVAILGILQILGGGLFLLAAAGLLLGDRMGLGQQMYHAANLPVRQDVQVTLGVIALVVGLIQLILGFGLLSLKAWAWALSAFGAGANFVFGMIGIADGIRLSQEQSFSMVVSLIVLLYLLLPGVREAFFKKAAVQG